MKVWAAVPADMPLLAALHAACFEEPWDEAAFSQLLEGETAFALLAGDGDAAIPQAFILVRVAAGESEILSLGTAGEARRTRLARALVHAAAEEALKRGANEMFLEVAADNRAAVELYRGAGFRAVGGRPGYYHRQGRAVDAVILRAALPVRFS